MSNHHKLITTRNVLFVSTLLLAGCTSTKTSTTARTATEQLLLSTATDHALHKIGLHMFANRSVFIDTTYFDSYDAKYVVGTLRDALSRMGALIAASPTKCDVILEVRSGGLGINDSQTIFGFPSMGLPVPLAGTVQTPEVAFYLSDRQRSYAKFALVAYDRQTMAHLYSSGSLDGKSYNKKSRLLFIHWHRTDIPELLSDKKESQKHQTWSPQYDSENLTTTNVPAK